MVGKNVKREKKHTDQCKSNIAMQHKKREKVIEFFDLYGPELHGKPEWSQWFGK